MSANPVVSVVRYRASDWVDGLAVESLRRFFKGNVWIRLLRCRLTVIKLSLN